MAIYEALRQSTQHPTAEELFQIVRPHAGRLSRATVYNTLEALCEAGLARRMATTHGCCRYDADTSEHPHFRSRDTSEICDVPLDLGSKLISNLPKSVLADIERRMGIEIDGTSIQLLGRRVISGGKSNSSG